MHGSTIHFMGMPCQLNQGRKQKMLQAGRQAGTQVQMPHHHQPNLQFLQRAYSGSL
jgi:hypothetical protein